MKTLSQVNKGIVNRHGSYRTAYRQYEEATRKLDDADLANESQGQGLSKGAKTLRASEAARAVELAAQLKDHDKTVGSVEKTISARQAYIAEHRRIGNARLEAAHAAGPLAVDAASKSSIASEALAKDTAHYQSNGAAYEDIAAIDAHMDGVRLSIDHPLHASSDPKPRASQP